MIRNRLELHEILCDILGTRHCYFSPPASISMTYPCIKYEVNRIETLTADNHRYKNDTRYTLTVIDYDADSEVTKRLFEDERLLYVNSDRVYVVDGLYHYVYTIY